MNLKDKYESDSAEYRDSLPTRRKRRKVINGLARPADESSTVFNASLAFDELDSRDPTIDSFQDILDPILPDLLLSRVTIQDKATEVNDQGQKVRPLTRSEVSSFISSIASQSTPPSLSGAITARKLKVIQQKRRANLPLIGLRASSTVTPLSPPPPSLPPHPLVVDALYNIQTTPFEFSFLSRLQGTTVQPTTAIAVDCETVTPWMRLTSDIRAHYTLSHPDRERPVESSAPITYAFLQRYHLEQVHDLLQRVFWTGINVSDSLDYSPERCTVVATYKRLVVGIAILSSPRETYITYLAVRAGWDNVRIARSMLYHLIKLNPNKDITLHVSVNNSAMLLYNRFGFKAEEFVAGFYEDYLDPHSRASKNAFRLRLRQQ